ncbi:multidrug resistance protein [Niveomyces insectorum RCEF 264]|uniref:Multidrug resistance protein n=1 Tax=Niveomyces insectorum RCEF 264 TaxID=1081102 RepID=A0A167QDY3_9HYPO|nr:multidrug resistance protein [Niveomyces insectorum RCEF 264]
MAGDAIAAGGPDERSPLLAFPPPAAHSSVQTLSAVSVVSSSSTSKKNGTEVHITTASSGDDDDDDDDDDQASHRRPSFTESLSTDTSLLRDIEAEAAAAAATQKPNEPGSNKNDNYATVARVVLVLMIGVFVSNADGSLVLATHPVIASEFHDLESSSWLFSGFILASAATQTMYGKLSDIYGRKNLVLVSYVFFTGGCTLVGAGKSMFQVILGRVISGAGGAGMTALVSILISDLLPIRDVASWRAYVNVVATTGRSLGGPLGGWLADVIGWRWSFIGQVPFMLVAILLCMVYLPDKASRVIKNGHAGAGSPSSSSTTTPTAWSRLRRIDFLGSGLLALGLLAFLVPMEIGGVKVPWSAPLVPGLFAASAVLLVLFVRAERRATDPVVPLTLFRLRDANLSIAIQMCQMAAQLGLMFSVPLYFKASADVSNTVAGAHLFPAVVGNAVGGILSGLYIKATGRYRNLIRLAALSSSLSYLLLLLRWKGHTNWPESLYIVPGGFGTGIVQSAVFISLQAVVPAGHLAPAISILYLSGTCASIVGLTCVSTTTQETLKWGLQSRLLGLGLDAAQRAEIYRNALSNIEYLATLTGAVKAAVVDAYVDSLWWSHTVSLFFSSTAFFLALILGEKPLNKVEPPQPQQNDEAEA